jgi:hypothetical protein
LGEDVGLHFFGKSDFASGGTRRHALIPSPKIRIATPLPFEQFFTSDPLGIIAVPNLDPTGRLIRQVRPRFPFGDNALKIVLARQPEQPVAVVLGMVAVERRYCGKARNVKVGVRVDHYGGVKLDQRTGQEIGDWRGGWRL